MLHRIFKCSYGAYVLPPRGVSDCIAIFSRRIRADDEDVRVATIRADVSDSAARFRLPRRTPFSIRIPLQLFTEDKIGIRDTRHASFCDLTVFKIKCDPKKKT